MCHSHPAVISAHDDFLSSVPRLELYDMGADKVWRRLQAITNAISAWMRTMLMLGVVGPDALLDLSNMGMLKFWKASVVTPVVKEGISAIEQWYAGHPSGAHSLLSRVGTEMHRANNILHVAFGEDKAAPLPVAAINLISQRANRQKSCAKAKQHRDAIARGKDADGRMCDPSFVESLCSALLDWLEGTLDALLTGGSDSRADPGSLIPGITVTGEMMGYMSAAINAVLVASTMARKCGIVNVRAGDVMPSLCRPPDPTVASYIEPVDDKTPYNVEKVWPISKRVDKIIRQWRAAWALGRNNFPLIPCWGGSSSTRGTMAWCIHQCSRELGLDGTENVERRAQVGAARAFALLHKCTFALFSLFHIFTFALLHFCTSNPKHLACFVCAGVQRGRQSHTGQVHCPLQDHAAVRVLAQANVC